MRSRVLSLGAATLVALALAGACARGTAERSGADTVGGASGAPAPGEARGVPPEGKVPPSAGDPGIVPLPGAASPSLQADAATLQRLEREARTLARTDGCAGVAQCAMAPVGSRPCGGPRTYIPYCRGSTDSAALFRKLDELARTERAFNEKQGMMSTCEFRQPPTPTYSGGRCGPAPAP